MSIVNPYGEYPYGEILVSHKNEWRTDTHRSVDRASLVAQTVKNPPAMQETWVWPLGWEDPLEEGMQTTPVSLHGESHGLRSLLGYSL